jgi:polyphosphate kinase
MIELIEKEGSYGTDGRIVWKLNNLVDRRIIDALYAVSQAGTQVDLVIRAMCCLRPGVPGLSENIRVRSLVGRYLEHSRIFYFSEGAASLVKAPVGDGLGPVIAPTGGVGLSLPAGGRYLLGSADMMERNLDRRVEALVDVTSEEIQVRLREILEVVLADDELAWELAADGTWGKVPATKHFNAQRHFQELALSRSRRRGSSERLAEIG